jgi:hypothetical protein
MQQILMEKIRQISVPVHVPDHSTIKGDKSRDLRVQYTKKYFRYTMRHLSNLGVLNLEP